MLTWLVVAVIEKEIHFAIYYMHNFINKKVLVLQVESELTQDQKYKLSGYQVIWLNLKVLIYSSFIYVQICWIGSWLKLSYEL